MAMAARARNCRESRFGRTLPTSIRGKFEFDKDGSFIVCDRGADLQSEYGSETSSMRAEITTIPDCDSLPLEEPWDGEAATASSSHKTSGRTKPSDFLLCAGDWQNDSVARPSDPLVLPWRLEPVSLADFEDPEPEPLLAETPPPLYSGESDLTRTLKLRRLPKRYYGERSIAESADSAPGMTDGSSRDSDSICFPERASRHVDDVVQVELTELPFTPYDHIIPLPNHPNVFPTSLSESWKGYAFPSSNRWSVKADDDIGIPDQSTSPREAPAPKINARLPRRGVVDEDASESSDEGLTDSESAWMSDYSESVPVFEDGHPFYHIKSAVVKTALATFETWNRSTSGHIRQRGGKGADARGSGPSAGKGTAPSGSRQAAEAPEKKRKEEASDDDGQGQPRKRSRTTKQSTGRQVSLACPFAKKDAIKYRGCYAYVLKRTQDVKQHLSRCHQLPIYCPRCKETFASEDERDDHAMNTVCQVRNDIAYEGVTRAQKRQLTQRVSSRMALEEQWFAIFDILFPNHAPRPKSAYVNTDLTVDLEAFQDMMVAEGPTIILSTLESHGIRLAAITNEEHNLSALQQVALMEGMQEIAQRWATAFIRGSGAAEDSHADGSITSETSRPRASSEMSRTSSDTLVETRRLSRRASPPLDCLREESESERGNTPGQSNGEDFQSRLEGIAPTTGYAEMAGDGAAIDAPHDVLTLGDVDLDQPENSNSVFRMGEAGSPSAMIRPDLRLHDILFDGDTGHEAADAFFEKALQELESEGSDWRTTI